jgi:calcyclin binding protein
MADDELGLDLEELKQLQSVAQRPRVISLLSSEILKLEKLSREASAQVATAAPIPIPTPVKVVSATPTISYSMLGSFSWDQDSEKVKIYISIEGVDKEKVEADFKETSIDVKIHDVQGKNYRYVLPKLNKEIVPEKCKVLVKPTRIVMTLVKASKGNWLDLQYKEDKLKPNLEKDSKDPMAGIMDLMKNMYEDGDEEMKKTIAKAWTDARSGKGADPLKGYR